MPQAKHAHATAPGLDRETFERFSRLIYEKSGIRLQNGKEALLTSRLGRRMRQLGLSDYRQYLRRVAEDRDDGELVHLLDAVSTNVTHFFREDDHFRFLSEDFLERLRRGQRRFRYWSAACSTGEEPYSLAISLLEAAGGSAEARGLDLRVLATDISTRVLARAMEGLYPADRMESIPPHLRSRWFTPPAASGGPWQTAPELRALVRFARINLSDTPFPMRGPMDGVLCRNVMIYFDDEVRTRLVQDIRRLLAPDGHLLVGHAESLAGITSGLRALAPSIYRKS